MQLECDLSLELESHDYRLTSRPTTGGKPVLDLRVDSLVALLPLARQALRINELTRHLPRRLCEVHLWVGDREWGSIEVPR